MYYTTDYKDLKNLPIGAIIWTDYVPLTSDNNSRVFQKTGAGWLRVGDHYIYDTYDIIREGGGAKVIVSGVEEKSTLEDLREFSMKQTVELAVMDYRNETAVEYLKKALKELTKNER